MIKRGYELLKTEDIYLPTQNGGYPFTFLALVSNGDAHRVACQNDVRTVGKSLCPNISNFCSL